MYPCGLRSMALVFQHLSGRCLVMIYSGSYHKNVEEFARRLDGNPVVNVAVLDSLFFHVTDYFTEH